MWDQAGTWVLGVLAVASSAGWLASRSTHSLRRLKAEAEVLPLLPASDEKQALESHVRLSVQRYLRGRDVLVRLRTQWVIVIVLLIVAPVVALIGGWVEQLRPDGPDWSFWSAMTAAGMSTAGALWLVGLVVVARRVQNADEHA